MLSKAKQSKAKQSKAKQSKAKQSKAKLLLYLLTNNYFKFLFQKYFLNLVKSFLTLIKFNFDSLSRKIKISCLVINKIYFKIMLRLTARRSEARRTMWVLA